MKTINAACHLFIATVFAGPWCYLLLAVVPDSWVDWMAPISLALFCLAVYFTIKFLRDRNVYTTFVACAYVGAFVLPILLRPIFLKPQLEEAMRRAEDIQVRLEVYRQEYGEYPHMFFNLRTFDDLAIIKPGLGINAPGAFRYVHGDDSPDYQLSFDGTFAQDYLLGPDGWTTSGPWFSKLFGYPLESRPERPTMN